jgi:GNAT superfamily N-acetyltransferase
MVHTLSKAKLKSGEEMEIVVVVPPDRVYQPKIPSFLAHKGQPWAYHMEQVFGGGTQDLETRFYLGLVDGEPICSIMTSECDGVGILSHVYTKPEHRRKGACDLLMEKQMGDWRRRGGGHMLLTTQCGTPPYRIYHHFGFRSVVPRSGLMECASEEDFRARHFAPAPVKVIDYEWTSWPGLNMLCSCPEGKIVRSVSFQLFGPSSFEDPGIILKQSLEQIPQARARLLKSDNRAVVGWAFVLPDSRWAGVNLLDFFLHPDFESSAEELLESLDLPAGKCQCYVDVPAPVRTVALHKAGFRQEAVLRSQLEYEGAATDIAVFSTSV